MMLRLAAIGAALVLVVVIALMVIGGPDSREQDPASVAAAEPAAGGEPAVAEAPRTPDQGRVETAVAAPGPTAVAAPAAIVAPPPPIGGPFRLTNVNGEEVTEAALVGHPSLIAFGYTNCRESCPPLADLGAWLDTLGGDGADLAVYFVTVDPERDTREALAAFLGQFNPRIIGLTGTPAEIDAMLGQFQVAHARLPGNGAAAGYDVEHPGWFYLHNGTGAYAGRMAYSDAPEEVLMRLRGFAIAHYVPERLDALCGTLRATDRAAALATYPTALWRTCAERGFAEAQYGLAIMIDEGVVFPRDTREAYIWAIRAGQALSPLAVRLQEGMRTLEMEDNIRFAQDWVPTR